MRIRLIAHGRIGRSPEAELYQRYVDRLPWDVQLTELAVGAPIPWPDKGARIVLLDERGKGLDSEAFAARIGRWRDDGVREIAFLIGGADGFSDADRARADLLLAFGPMTWPHMMARAMLAEQWWRAASILAGHPYHRAG